MALRQYDKNWFEMWGHPLDENELGGAFEKSLVTNQLGSYSGQQNRQSKQISPARTR